MRSLASSPDKKREKVDGFLFYLCFFLSDMMAVIAIMSIGKTMTANSGTTEAPIRVNRTFYIFTSSVVTLMGFVKQ